MPFTILTGSFVPKFGRPDGDSVRFVPDDPAPLFRLKRRGRPPRLNATNGSIQLRFEGIDTPETGAALPWSAEATEALLRDLPLDLAGASRAWIATTQIGPNGRPIAFAFTTEPPAGHGEQVWLDPDSIRASLNWSQLERGLAYPLFYDTLFDDLREVMRAEASSAREDGRGLWKDDRTQSGATWTGNADTLPPLWPKLWRRIDDYVRDETFFDPSAPMRGLKDWIAFEKPERVAVATTGTFTGFDDIIETTDNTVQLKVDPLDVVVVSLPMAETAM